MVEIMVKIMIEILSILAIATIEVKQSKTSELTLEEKCPSWFTILQKRF
jgi:hypothetical protein